ncbi:MAG: preprotein translocase subunit SecG [Candidatus Omnitrophica bacterium 4484_171]|nr:MAG: preprotein translocase subunit SecG [Candidatus Omnitrophica bacterium 4484_171]
MYNFVLTIHIIVVIALIGIVLIQRGRSSGLIEALGGVESIFGTKTNAFFVKATAFLFVLFFITSITLAYLSKNMSNSLLNKASLAKTASESKMKVNKDSVPVQSKDNLSKTPKENEGAHK